MGRFHIEPRRRCGVLLLTTLCVAGNLFAAGRGEPGPVHAVRIDHVDQEQELKLLHQLDVDIDAVSDGWSRVYLIEEEIGKLQALGLQLTVLTREEVLGPLDRTPDEPRREATAVPAQYHTYDTLTSDLQAIAAAHPEITRLVSIGQSVQGRELWMMRISDNVTVEEDEVELTLISSMHGDEVVGKELCVNLINHLTQNYGSDPRVTRLVDQTEVWIMPSMNPDGTELQQRYNAKGFDLNRDFPDQFVDPSNSITNRQIETAAVMNWAAGRSIDLAANFHGGALVVNYPFDSNPSGLSVFSPAPDPDHQLFVSISRSYADANLPMSANNSHPAFDNGITNGADWYAINGGMQDWAYVWHGTLPVLMEVSQLKWPPANKLPDFWDENMESLLAFLERGLDGVRGLVTDAETGQPVAATLRVDENPHPTFNDPDVGDYHRPLLPGNYTLTVSAAGYTDRSIPISVPTGPAVRYDVDLVPLATALNPTGLRVIDPNGVAEPGETVDLAVTLTNAGRSATAIRTTLVPTGWFAEVVREQADYPDIPTGSNAESDPPHFGVAISTQVPAGHKSGFAIVWSSDQGSAVSGPLFVNVGETQCGTVPSSDVPHAIVDQATVTSTLDVFADIELTQTLVAVDLTHSYIGDLRLTLRSPAGTEVVLHDRTGSSTDDIVGTYGAELVPAQTLETLAEQPALGLWTLEIRDDASGDTGLLNSWSVTTCGRPVEAAPPEMRLRALSVHGTAVQLDWWPYPGLETYRIYRSSDAASPSAFVDLTATDVDPTDTRFVDDTGGPLQFYLVTGVGPRGEGPKGHFGE